MDFNSVGTNIGDVLTQLQQNPQFLAGLNLLSGTRKTPIGETIMNSYLQSSQLAGQQQQQALVKAKLAQMQAAQNFNPQDYMQTTPSQGTQMPQGLAQLMQQPQMPAALGGPNGMGAPIQQPQLPTQIPAPAPGQPGQLNYPGLLSGGLNAGYSPTEINGMAGILDPEMAIRQQIALKMAEPHTLGPSQKLVNGQGATLAENTNQPASSPYALIQLFTQKRDEANANGDSETAATMQAAIDRFSGAAAQRHQSALEKEADVRANLSKGRLSAMQGDPDAVAATVDMIGQGRMQPPTGRSMSTPFMQQVMEQLAQKYPDYDAKVYGQQAQSVKAFATGQEGKMTRSINVSMNHLDTLGQLADALHNGDTPMINNLAQQYAQQTGNPAPTNFDAAKQFVANEIMKSVQPQGGTGHERDDVMANVSRANSPEQLAGAIETWQKLLGGQLVEFERQYKRTTGKNDFRSNQFLGEAAQKLLPPAQGETPAGGVSIGSATPDDIRAALARKRGKK